MNDLTKRGYNQWLSAEYGVLIGEGAFLVEKVFQTGSLEKSFQSMTEPQFTAFLAFQAFAFASSIVRTSGVARRLLEKLE